jgi:hypothetical protein
MGMPVVTPPVFTFSRFWEISAVETIWGIIVVTTLLIMPFRIVMDLIKQKDDDKR